MVKHSPRSHPCCKAGRGRGFYQWDAPFSGGRCVWPCWPLWTRRLGPQGRMLPHILRVDIHACAVRVRPGFAIKIDWSGHPLGCLCDARQWPQPWCTPHDDGLRRLALLVTVWPLSCVTQAAQWVAAPINLHRKPRANTHSTRVYIHAQCVGHHTAPWSRAVCAPCICREERW